MSLLSLERSMSLPNNVKELKTSYLMLLAVRHSFVKTQYRQVAAIGVEQPRSVGNPLRDWSPVKPASRVIMFLTREAGFSVIQTSVSNRCRY